MPRRPALVFALFLVACKAQPSPAPSPSGSVAASTGAPSASAQSDAGRSPFTTLPIAELGVDPGRAVCALYEDGTIACAGRNDGGQLGRGTRAAGMTWEPPAKVPGIAGAKSLAVGSFNACVVTKDDHVQCWGQLIDADGTRYASSPTPVPNLDDVVSLSVSGTMNCALSRNGTVACWGDNSLGQLGDGTKVNRFTPVAIAGVSGAKAIVTGVSFGCAITKTRGVRCWGTRTFGGLEKIDELASGSMSVCARRGADVSCSSLFDDPFTKLPELSGTTRLFMANDTACALMAGGKLTCMPSTPGATASTRVVDAASKALASGATCVVTGAGRADCGGQGDFAKLIEQL